jgi:Protein of unknown function (DUF5132)
MSHESSAETHGEVDRAVGTRATGRSFAAGVKGAVLFFTPSVVVGLVAPFVFPAIRRAARPVVKGVIKGALTLGESLKEGAAGAREELSDLLAEVKAEREKESVESASPTGRG